MKIITKWITSLAPACLITLGLASAPCAAAVGNGPADPAAETASQCGASQFQLIVQRNIFDPNRGNDATNGESAATNRQPRIETFSFRGAAEMGGRGFDAFFTGDGAPTNGTVAVNDQINGFKVQEISLFEVRLLDTNHQVVILKDQTGMTRQNGGPWIEISAPATYNSSTQRRTRL